MARNITLTKLLTDYRAAIRASKSSAHNVQVEDSQKTLLQKTQEWLHEEYDWPHLRVERREPLQSGQRYYTPPADIAIDRIEKIEVRYGGQWIKLEAGINAGDYSQWDSELDQRSWPALKWKISEDGLGDLDQIEIWPIPESNGTADDLEGYLKVTGIKDLADLVSSSDRCSIDGRLIVGYAAAETLAGNGAKDAATKLSQANKLFARLRGNLEPRRSFSMFGAGRSGDPDGRRRLNGPPSVHYRIVDGG